MTDSIKLADLPADVIGWLRETDDIWLREQYLHRAEAGNPWGIAVATGQFGRLRDIQPDEARRFVAATLAGRPYEPAIKHLRWAEALDDHQVSDLADLAREAAYTIHHLLDVGEILQARIGRDELEGVAVMLRWIGDLALDGFLADIDARGSKVGGLWPRTGSEVLRRAAYRTPEAWWVEREGVEG